MEIGARPATGSDLDLIEALADAAVAELTPHRGGEVWANLEARPRPQRDALAAAIDDDRSLVVVGTIDDVVVGYAVVHEVARHDGDRIADLSDLFVLPGARGVGVGEELMGPVLDWSAARGCRGLDSLALPGDRATKNFFERFGLTARALRVHRRLDPS